MTDAEVDAAVLAAYEALPGSPIERAGDVLWRAIYRAAYAQALEDAARACDKALPCSRESAPEHWKSYAAAWGLREAVVKECAAAIRALPR
jgi:hypothetical protein